MKTKSLKWIVSILAFVLVCASALTFSKDQASAASVYMKVVVDSNDTLNVRSGAGVKYKVVTKLKRNTVVTRTKTSNGWSKITYNKKTGWVNTKYLKKVVVKAAAKPLANFTFVVDAGHGGSDRGAFYYNVKEKDVNLKAAKELQKQLVAKGATVVMTRKKDVFPSLEARVKTSKKTKPDAYISIHHNASKTGNKTDKGYLVLYTKKAEKTLASSVYSGMKKVLKKNTTVPAEGYRYQNLHVLRENPYKGILLEYGYMSTPSELKKINTNSYRTHVATGVVNGLMNYFD